MKSHQWMVRKTKYGILYAFCELLFCTFLCLLICAPGFRWSHEAIMLLLDEYRQREEDMYRGKISHKKAWNQIADIMNAKGYFVTGKQCNTRINTMKRT